MRTRTVVAMAALGAAAVVVVEQPRLHAQSQAAPPRPGSTEIAGAVSGPRGPESGVWVIAETAGLATKFAKIVVTDERGRYLLPDLTPAAYRVWVRGYGLVDSAPVEATPGTTLDLRAVVAPSAGAAAEYYPAVYWYSMLRVPDAGEFPGTGPEGNGIPRAMKSQSQWLDVVKTNGWGAEAIWDSQTSMHNPMLDEKGRVWFTSRVRPPANPDVCKKGSEHPSAKLTPLESANRHLSMYDPRTGKIVLIGTCFPTHHLVFAEDARNTLWTSAGGPQSGVVGWLDRKLFEETGDEARSQGGRPPCSTPTATEAATRATPSSRRPSTASPSIPSTARSGAACSATRGTSLG